MKPTQAEVAELVGRLRECADDPMWADHCEMTKHTVRESADALEALAGEGAEPVAHEEMLRLLNDALDGAIDATRAKDDDMWREQYNKMHDAKDALVKLIRSAPPAKPAGELPMQVEQALEAAIRRHSGDKYRFSNDESARKVWSDHSELLVGALRALRERM